MSEEKRRRIELVRRRNKIKSPSAVAKAILGEAPEPEPDLLPQFLT